MKKIVYLDMDGTIADLYSQNNWLEALRAEQDGLFISCKPLTTQDELLAFFPTEIYEIRICSMTPKEASDDYCQRVIEEKNAWLDEYFPIITHRVYMKYGHNKNLRNSVNHILVDDNEIIRENFRGLALPPLWL